MKLRDWLSVNPLLLAALMLLLAMAGAILARAPWIVAGLGAAYIVTYGLYVVADIRRAHRICERECERYKEMPK